MCDFGAKGGVENSKMVAGGKWLRERGKGGILPSRFGANWGCTPKPSKIPSNWISDFHSLPLCCPLIKKINTVNQ